MALHMRIRPYEPADQNALVDLWRAADLMRNPLNDPATDIAMCLADGHGEILIGEIDGALVASAMVGHDGHRGWIYYVASDPERPGQGLGRQIMAAAEDWIRARGLPKVQLLVRQSNTRVIGFYQRLGYNMDPANLLSKRLDGNPLPLAQQSNQDPVTVTYLRMHERPQLPVTMPKVKNYSLLRAKAPTVRFYRYLYDAVGRNWFWTDRKKYSDQALAEILDDPMVDLYVLFLDGVPAGFFELDRRQMPEIDLAYFGIIEDYIGLGLGPWLLRQAIDAAWQHEPLTFTVNTCTLDHPAALPMYQRFGFTVYDRKVVPAPWQQKDNVIDFA